MICTPAPPPTVPLYRRGRRTTLAGVGMVLLVAMCCLSSRQFPDWVFSLLVSLFGCVLVVQLFFDCWRALLFWGLLAVTVCAVALMLSCCLCAKPGRDRGWEMYGMFIVMWALALLAGVWLGGYVMVLLTAALIEW
jgi:hypothetical protein